MPMTATSDRCPKVPPADGVAEAQARLATLLEDMQALIGIVPVHPARKPVPDDDADAEDCFDNLPV